MQRKSSPEEVKSSESQEQRKSSPEKIKSGESPVKRKSSPEKFKSRERNESAVRKSSAHL